MSRFKTDHLALPDTAATLARAVPPGAEQLLLPPSVQAAIQSAQQQAQQQAGTGEAPTDAAGLADQFLSSLAADLMGGGSAAAAAGSGSGPGAASGGVVAAPQPPGLAAPLPGQPPLPEQPPLPPAEAEAEEAAVAAVVERPIDLFKAIFEDSEEESEDQVGGLAGPIAGDDDSGGVEGMLEWSWLT